MADLEAHLRIDVAAAREGVASNRQGLILVAITAWDQTTSKGQGQGEFVFLLSERERNDLAEHINRTVFGEDGSGAPSYGELIQAEADVRAELAALRAEITQPGVLIANSRHWLERHAPLIAALLNQPVREER